MTRVIPIIAQCPACHSQDVFYTCHVTCCYNHVCNACRTTFETKTRFLRPSSSTPELPAGEHDTTLPTAPCAQCEKPVIFHFGQMKETGELYCHHCCSVLALEYENVVRPT